MNNLTDVVKQLIIINIILFIGTTYLPMLPELKSMLALHKPGAGNFMPIQLVTHMFMHASLSHLFFNMLGLFFFGPWLERLWGSKKFLIFYLFSGLGGLVGHLLLGFDYSYPVDQVVLGASGAVVGIVVGFALNFPEQKIMLLIPPMPVKAKYLAIFYVGYDLFMGLTNASSGIAHFAHLGGALFGFLLILFWRKFPTRM